MEEAERFDLCCELTEIARTMMNEKWVVLGDLKEVLMLVERQGMRIFLIRAR